MSDIPQNNELESIESFPQVLSIDPKAIKFINIRKWMSASWINKTPESFQLMMERMKWKYEDGEILQCAIEALQSGTENTKAGAFRVIEYALPLLPAELVDEHGIKDFVTNYVLQHKDDPEFVEMGIIACRIVDDPQLKSEVISRGLEIIGLDFRNNQIMNMYSSWNSNTRVDLDVYALKARRLREAFGDQIFAPFIETLRTQIKTHALYSQEELYEKDKWGSCTPRWVQVPQVKFDNEEKLHVIMSLIRVLGSSAQSLLPEVCEFTDEPNTQQHNAIRAVRSMVTDKECDPYRKLTELASSNDESARKMANGVLGPLEYSSVSQLDENQRNRLIEGIVQTCIRYLGGDTNTAIAEVIDDRPDLAVPAAGLSLFDVTPGTGEQLHKFEASLRSSLHQLFDCILEYDGGYREDICIGSGDYNGASGLIAQAMEKAGIQNSSIDSYFPVHWNLYISKNGRRVFETGPNTGYGKSDIANLDDESDHDAVE